MNSLDIQKKDSFSQKIKKLTNFREIYKEFENKYLTTFNKTTQFKTEELTKKGPLGGLLGGQLEGGKQKQQNSNAIHNKQEMKWYE
ncbi:unnamed protein product [Paramecium sonneborni]|nr:unnamed protein product [Paramecium sonneborni]